MTRVSEQSTRVTVLENVVGGRGGSCFPFLAAAAYDCAGDFVKNLRIFATLVSGVQLELSDCPTGRDLVRALLPYTDEPPRHS